MAEPLKNHFDERVPRAIAAQIVGVWPAFSRNAFLSDVVKGYDDLGLMDRGRHIARMLRRHLPDSYPEALDVLLHTRRCRMKSLVVSLCIIVLSAATAVAQEPVAPFGVRVTSISAGDPEVDQLEREISEIIRHQLRGREIASHGKIQSTVIVDAFTDAVSGRVVLSLTSMNGLPQEVIELGAKEEAFYLSWDGDAPPEEGALVRQHMSRDWLSQFHQVSAQELRLIEVDRLENAISEMLDNLNL